MSRRVRLTIAAAEYLRGEAQYIRQRSPQAARNLLEDLRRLKRQLSAFPESGVRNTMPGYVGSRKIVLGDYVVFYDVGADIEILLIRHGRQIDTLVTPEDPDPER
jgi:plasmid stabilization system protein ParE